jgi:6,7-dimethyl-8-ribityllumazine synthase
MIVRQGKLIATGRRFAVVVSRFNQFITSKLLDGAVDCLQRHGAKEADVEVFWVPGAFEIPYLAKKLAVEGKHHGIICLGAIIRGDTPHFGYVANEVAKGIAQTALETGLPVVYGVITADTVEQAVERAGTKAGNRGFDAALSAIELVDLYGSMPRRKRP